MIRFARALMVCVPMAAAASCYAAAAAETPPPATDALQPAAPPAKPAVAPTGFPVLVIPGAILIGIAAAVSTQDNDAEFSTSTGTTGTR